MQDHGSSLRQLAWSWFAVAVFLTPAASLATVQSTPAPNQTHGFGNGRLVTFTYLQNFDCVDRPLLDHDLNGIRAQSDPNEMQTPICRPVTEPTQDPTGGDIKRTAYLYVLAPMFSVDNAQNRAEAIACPDGGRPGALCGTALGKVDREVPLFIFTFVLQPLRSRFGGLYV